MSSIFDQQVIFYTMLAFGGILVEGFLLSFTFIIISRRIQINTHSKLRDYLRTSAIGVAILFVSFFANPSAGSYLPFGVIAASFFGFGGYLFFSGIYASAISIASDLRLRQTIRKTFLDQSNLFDNIGLAETSRALEKQTGDILKKHKENIEKETGIESPISELDVKNYLEEVVEAVQKERGRKPIKGK